MRRIIDLVIAKAADQIKENIAINPENVKLVSELSETTSKIEFVDGNFRLVEGSFGDVIYALTGRRHNE